MKSSAAYKKPFPTLANVVFGTGSLKCMNSLKSALNDVTAQNNEVAATVTSNKVFPSSCFSSFVLSVRHTHTQETSWFHI